MKHSHRELDTLDGGTVSLDVSHCDVCSCDLGGGTCSLCHSVQAGLLAPLLPSITRLPQARDALLAQYPGALTPEGSYAPGTLVLVLRFRLQHGAYQAQFGRILRQRPQHVWVHVERPRGYPLYRTLIIRRLGSLLWPVATPGVQEPAPVAVSRPPVLGEIVTETATRVRKEEGWRVLETALAQSTQDRGELPKAFEDRLVQAALTYIAREGLGMLVTMPGVSEVLRVVFAHALKEMTGDAMRVVYPDHEAVMRSLPTPVSYAADLARIRQALGLSQPAFGALLGTTGNQISRYERRRVPVPEPEMRLARLASTHLDLVRQAALGPLRDIPSKPVSPAVRYKHFKDRPHSRGRTHIIVEEQPYASTALELREIRSHLGLTQQDFATALGLGPYSQMIRSYETGQRAPRKALLYLARLARNHLDLVRQVAHKPRPLTPGHGEAEPSPSPRSKEICHDTTEPGCPGPGCPGPGRTGSMAGHAYGSR
jgi:DNA-binding transcriptional regulator YiaG